MIGCLAVAALAMGGCDSTDELEVLQVAGRWTSGAFTQVDQGGNPVGQASLELEFEQDGDDLTGEGVVHLPQARIDLPFAVSGRSMERSIQFTMQYETAGPEVVNCTPDSETRLKCLKRGANFIMDRE